MVYSISVPARDPLPTIMPRSRSTIIFLLLLLCLTAVFPADVAQERMPSGSSALQRKGADVVISALGDIMMPSSIQDAVARNGWRYDILFEKIAGDLSGDIIFGNLETPVDDGAPVSGYPRFNARIELLAALKKAGVRIVSAANNHVLDVGPEGLKRTLDNLDKAGILFTGAGRTRAEAERIQRIGVRDITAAFLAYTYGTNRGMPRKKKGMPSINILRSGSAGDLARAVAAVKRARSSADLVVVSLHWSDEYHDQPNPWQRRAAAELIEAGADVILGHHPHVLQPIESYAARDGRTGLIAYSLGNFISSQNYGITDGNRSHARANRGDGIVLNLHVRKEDGRTFLTKAEFLPIWSNCEKTGKAVLFRPLYIDRELARLTAAGAARTPDEEKLLSLLSYRRSVILDHFAVKPGKQAR